MTYSLSNSYINKSEIYDKARPLYPQEALLFIRHQLNLSSELPVLDIGSGTGILTRQLAAIGIPMIGIEPDIQMLSKARERTNLLNVEYCHGSAEQLEMASCSIAALVCGQSFHWFEPNKTISEFRRVLATNNPVFLIWNIRDPDYDKFHCSYEQLLKTYFKRYSEALQIDNILESRIHQFFNGNFKECTFNNSQKLDMIGLIERTMSCSYAPEIKTPEYDCAISALKILHQSYQKNNLISINYKTRVIYGHI
ncbi:class I SAM-dependent methyltransferase [Xenorhabdus sp. ZM]|uniref:class I SAM-dependent methyltransferase n=1 Tax=Xenorhabdus szentirmaii TaxID=290112 RepID=UPI0019AEE026|nr:class I SAM-dependent methyltransferase [Xenorhabdus sp. ZM]MBD2806910.1 class I SAM-dependent methyltransferase [Xenorhabdus sp. ZM]